MVCTVRQTHRGLRIFAGCASCARVLEYSLLLNGVFGAYWVGWHAAMATTTIPKVFTTFPLPLQHYSPSVLRCVSTRSHIRVPRLSQSGSSLVKNPHYKNPESCVPKQNLETGCRLPPQYKLTAGPNGWLLGQPRHRSTETRPGGVPVACLVRVERPRKTWTSSCPDPVVPGSRVSNSSAAVDQQTEVISFSRYRHDVAAMTADRVDTLVGRGAPPIPSGEWPVGQPL